MRSTLFGSEVRHSTIMGGNLTVLAHSICTLSNTVMALNSLYLDAGHPSLTY